MQKNKAGAFSALTNQVIVKSAGLSELEDTPEFPDFEDTAFFCALSFLGAIIWTAESPHKAV